MESSEALDQLDEMIRKAKGVPLSASVVIPKDDALALVASLRESLPHEHQIAKQVLADRDRVIAEAHAEATRIVEEARRQQDALMEKTTVMKTARARAKDTVEAAEAAAADLRHKADDYVDSKLASFEILLQRTVKTVHSGRETLRQRLEAAQDDVLPLSFEDSGEISLEPPAAPSSGD